MAVSATLAPSNNFSQHHRHHGHTYACSNHSGHHHDSFGHTYTLMSLLTTPPPPPIALTGPITVLTALFGHTSEILASPRPLIFALTNNMTVLTILPQPSTINLYRALRALREFLRPCSQKASSCASTAAAGQQGRYVSAAVGEAWATPTHLIIHS